LIVGVVGGSVISLAAEEGLPATAVTINSVRVG
jgi:hypothetical protein